jgi:hypothetical protein
MILKKKDAWWLCLIILTNFCKPIDEIFNEYNEQDVQSNTQTRAPGSWVQLPNPPWGGSLALTGFQLLLTDGSMLVENTGTQNIGTPNNGEMWVLKPDNMGIYANGTWTQVATLPTGYAPLYFASAVLPDGRAVYIGGKFNGPASVGSPTYTNMGAIYDPTANVWTSITPPAFFGSQIGNACSVILDDGTFMLQNPFGTNAALLNASTLSWTETGSGKADSNFNEGWTLLPNGKVLTVNCYTDDMVTPPANRRRTELYDPLTGLWTTTGDTTVSLISDPPPTNPNFGPMGPQVLRANGTVFAVGSSGATNIYDVTSGTWSTGPMLPVVPTEGQLSVPYGPGLLLPNGNVFFVAAAPPTTSQPPHFFEFDGINLIEQPQPPLAIAGGFAYRWGFLILPSGEVFVSNLFRNYIYTPGDTSHNSAWEPVIFDVPKKVRPNKTYKITGVLFNGMSQASMYGSNYQGATNYPLVRITNNSTGHVFYCRTHDHSYMGVAATNLKVSTNFDVPASIELGKSTIEVVTNGIASQPLCIYVDVSC